MHEDGTPRDGLNAALTRPAEMSLSVAKLAGALARAQGKIAGAEKEGFNPHYKSAYATLASVWEACRSALAAHGLAVSQLISADGQRVTVTTLLLHESGEWIRSVLTTQARGAGPQELGSASTYLRRYSLSAMVGVAPEDDDDGNAAQQSNRPAPAPQRPTPIDAPDEKAAEIVDAYHDQITAAQSEEEVRAIGGKLQGEPEVVRNACRAAYGARLKELRSEPPAPAKKPRKTAKEATGELLDLGAKDGAAEREPGSDG